MKGYGTVTLTAKDGCDKGKELVLKQVHLTPDLEQNVVSVKQVEASGLFFMKGGGCCQIFAGMQQTIVWGEQHKEIYVIPKVAEKLTRKKKQEKNISLVPDEKLKSALERFRSKYQAVPDEEKLNYGMGAKEVSYKEREKKGLKANFNKEAKVVDDLLTINKEKTIYIKPGLEVETKIKFPTERPLNKYEFTVSAKNVNKSVSFSQALNNVGTNAKSQLKTYIKSRQVHIFLEVPSNDKLALLEIEGYKVMLQKHKKRTLCYVMIISEHLHPEQLTKDGDVFMATLIFVDGKPVRLVADYYDVENPRQDERLQLILTLELAKYVVVVYTDNNSNVRCDARNSLTVVDHNKTHRIKTGWVIKSFI